MAASYNITTNCLLDCPFFHSYQEFFAELIRYPAHIRKMVQKVTSLQISFRNVPVDKGRKLNVHKPSPERLI